MANQATAKNLDAIENGKATMDFAAGDGSRGGAKEKDKRNGKDGEKNKKDIENEKPKSVGVIKLFFKYATMLELLYMFLGTCFAGLTGWVYTRRNTLGFFVP